MKAELNTGDKKVTIHENAMDRVIRYIAPIHANRRLQARMISALVGGYAGAQRTRRSLSSWVTRAGDPDSDILYDLPLLRERSRDLIRNVPLATGAVNTVCTNVVGTGLKLQSRIDREALGITEDEADSWEAATEREWRLWSESQECDAARTLNFSGIQDMVFRSTLENGDVFVLMPYVKRNSTPYGLKLQVIEADRVSNKDNSRDSETLAGGVARDRFGAPISYHIQDQHPGSVYGTSKPTWTVVAAFGRNTGRRNVIHLYRMLRPGQTRGVPYLAPVIEALKQLGRYTDSELMATVISSYFTVFVKSQLDEFAPMEPASEFAGSDDELKLGSGAIVGLAPGEDISCANPGRPNAAFDPFVLAVLRQIGVALELPFEVLVKHFTASYSAARAALLEAWKFFSTRRQWLASSFCQVVYEAWMDEAVASGRITAPGYFENPIIRKAYLGSEWIGPARGMIDELKEIKAARERVDMGISTLSEETSQLTGGDWDRKHRQQVKEQRMRERDGLIKTDPYDDSEDQVKFGGTD